MATKYRVARNSCSHAGIDYQIGDILPELPIDILNFHFPNLEIAKVEEGDQSVPTVAEEIFPVDFPLYQEPEPGEES